MELIKQSSTAYPLLFLMVDSTDHITGKTGLSPTVTISKAGAAFGSPAGAVTELSSGWYKVAGNATDTATLGTLILHATATGADPCDLKFFVVSFDPQDSVHFGLTGIPNAAAGASGGLPLGDASGRVQFQYGTATGQINLAGGKLTSATFAADSLTASALAADAVTEINAANLANLLIVQSGTARTGLIDAYNDRIQLAVSGASTVDSFYLWNMIVLTGGTGKGQSRVIIEYFGATQVAVCDRDWFTVPDATTTYAILGICSNWITDNGTVYPETHTGYAGNGVEFLTKANVPFDDYGNINANLVGINGSAGSDNHQVTGLAAMGVSYDTDGGVALTAGERTSIGLAVWNTLRSVTFAVGSFGEKIKLWLLQLGTDNRVLVSANTHTSGETVAGVTGGVGGGGASTEDIVAALEEAEFAKASDVDIDVTVELPG